MTPRERVKRAEYALKVAKRYARVSLILTILLWLASFAFPYYAVTPWISVPVVLYFTINLMGGAIIYHRRMTVLNGPFAFLFLLEEMSRQEPPQERP